MWAVFWGDSLCRRSRADHVSVELFAEDDVVLEAGFYFEVVLAFLVHISKLEHAVSDLLLEQRDLLLHAKPKLGPKLRVVLLLLLVLYHYYYIYYTLLLK